MSDPQGPDDMLNAIDSCKMSGLGSRVCTLSDFHQACGSLSMQASDGPVNFGDSDKSKNKAAYPILFGIKESKRRVKKLYESACDSLKVFGESSNAPGLENLSHPGFNPEIYPLLLRRLKIRRGGDKLPSTADSLLDLLDAIESSINRTPPLPGRIHPLSGWLAQPIEKWPDFSSQIIFSGNPVIGERLLSR